MNVEKSKKMLEDYEMMMKVHKPYLEEPKKEDYMITNENGEMVLDEDAYEDARYKHMSALNVQSVHRPLIDGCREVILQDDIKRKEELEKAN